MDIGTIGILIAAASVLFGISYSVIHALNIDTN